MTELFWKLLSFGVLWLIFTYGPVLGGWVRTDGMPWVLMTGATAALTLAAWLAWCERPRRCPRCGTTMALLDPDAERRHLTDEEWFEQTLGAVEHRIWRCPDCRKIHAERSLRLFSGYAQCPRCGRRTLQVRRENITSPTQFTLGERRIHRTCRWHDCDYRNTETQHYG